MRVSLYIYIFIAFVFQVGNSAGELRDTEGVQAGNTKFKPGKLTFASPPLTLFIKKKHILPL